LDPEPTVKENESGHSRQPSELQKPPFNFKFSACRTGVQRLLPLASKMCGTAPGHHLPVGVTFQFSLVGRPVIELSGRYSASKLITALAQSSHQETASVTAAKAQPKSRRCSRPRWAAIWPGGRRMSKATENR
jgi:hypothetical protein